MLSQKRQSPLVSLRFDHLELIMFRGFLTLRDFVQFETACSKWHYYILSSTKCSWYSNKFSEFQMDYNYSTFDLRKLTILKEQWFQRRKLIKLKEEVNIVGFDDDSTLIGTDILSNRVNIIKLSVHNSFKFIDCDSRKRLNGNEEEIEKEFSGFIDKQKNLKHLCFNYVPNLFCNGDDFLGHIVRLRNLMFLQIVGCDTYQLYYEYELFDFVRRRCKTLTTFHYIIDDVNGKVRNKPKNEHIAKMFREQVLDHCKLLSNISVHCSTTIRWGIDEVLLKKYSDKIAFDLYTNTSIYHDKYKLMRYNGETI